MSYRRRSGFLCKSGGGKTSSIPEEIFYEILLRLPVKSLLTCKCVCKNWYALISTSHFVKKHHNLVIQKNNPNLMLKVYAGNQFYSIGYDSLPSSSSVCEIKDHVIEMDHPYKSSPLHYWCVGFLGSSNGLICIWLLNLCSDKNLLCFWNPATREYRELPESPIGFNRTNACIHGLGYDHKTDDYKLAVGVKGPGIKRSTLVQVYTLASNLWKTEKTIPYRLCYLETCGVIVSGNLHWLALCRYNNFLLLSLDISDENFKELQLPREVQEMNKEELCLGVLHGCLCLFVGSYVDGVKSHSEVWEMQDYGIQESWTKCYVIAHESLINNQKYFRLMGSLKKDEILLLSGDILVLYDSKHGSATELKVDNIPFRYAETYFESLVSLNFGTYVVGERKRTPEETKARIRNFSKMSMFLIIVLAYIYVLFYFY